jgi:hypothetical protein
MLEHYRKEFTDFNISLNRTKYLYLSGQKVTFPITEIYDRYSDLFSLEAISSLKRALEEITEYYQTSRKALGRLIVFASEQYLNLKVKALTQEVLSAENRLHIEWTGQQIPLRNINNLLLNELNPQKRKEIYRKKLSALSSLNDLRGERVEKLHESTKELGYENYLQMFSQLNQVNYVDLDSKLQYFLADTEKLYTINLKRYLSVNLKLPLELASSADILTFTQRENFFSLFPSKALLPAYQETLLELGLRPSQQNNVLIDKEIRPAKHFGTFCLPITIPEEIKIVFQPSKGIKEYELFFQAIGKSEHFAFTNKNLLPEFKYCGDSGLTESYGFLFRHLVNNPFWLEQMLDERESSELLTASLLTRLYLIRRYAAKLNYELALHSKGINLAAKLYAEGVSKATQFQTDSAEYLIDYLDSFYVANYLRALMFEAMFRDYLKTHFGYKWWQNRKAGNLLKEMWDVGTRYSLEEFADQLGLGELISEPLEAEFFINLKC